jgi:hypothetical protein
MKLIEWGIDGRAGNHSSGRAFVPLRGPRAETGRFFGATAVKAVQSLDAHAVRAFRLMQEPRPTGSRSWAFVRGVLRMSRGRRAGHLAAYPPRANQMTSATATMARMMATNARALRSGPRLTPE